LVFLRRFMGFVQILFSAGNITIHHLKLNPGRESG